MIVILLIGLTLLASAAALIVHAAAIPRIRAAQRLRGILLYGFGTGDEEEVGDERRVGSPVTRVADLVGRLIGQRLPHVDLAAIRRDLYSAGLYTITPQVYLGFRILGCTVLVGLLAAALPGAELSGWLAVLLIVMSGVVGWVGPRSIVQARGRARHAEIDRELPELIDLLVVTIEAGLAFGAAQQMCARRLSGPLGSELRLALQEQSMGLSSDRAMANMLERCDTDSMRSFVRSLQQGERLGVSVGSILRALAVDLRQRRRQAAEERAQKAPIKILFPLILLIFPSLFLVLLGPAGFRLSEVF